MYYCTTVWTPDSQILPLAPGFVMKPSTSAARRVVGAVAAAGAGVAECRARDPSADGFEVVEAGRAPEQEGAVGSCTALLASETEAAAGILRQGMVLGAVQSRVMNVAARLAQKPAIQRAVLEELGVRVEPSAAGGPEEKYSRLWRENEELKGRKAASDAELAEREWERQQAQRFLAQLERQLGAKEDFEYLTVDEEDKEAAPAPPPRKAAPPFHKQKEAPDPEDPLWKLCLALSSVLVIFALTRRFSPTLARRAATLCTAIILALFAKHGDA